jgi:hypothetical protein
MFMNLPHKTHEMASHKMPIGIIQTTTKKNNVSHHAIESTRICVLPRTMRHGSMKTASKCCEIFWLNFILASGIRRRTDHW